jgi:hypothetical protein
VSESLLNSLGPAVVVFAIVALQFSRAGRRRARALAAERRAAGGSLAAPARRAPEPAAAPAAAAPAGRTTQPIARIPKRVETPAAPAAPVPKKTLVAGGPRWAANAVVAAEVFGPPLAARHGGTLGPPSAL